MAMQRRKFNFKEQVNLAFTKRGMSYLVHRIPSVVFWAFICSGLLLFGQTIF